MQHAAALLALTLALACGMVALDAPAHAATFQLENPVFSATVPVNNGPDPDQVAALFALTPLTLTISDAAVARGSFNFSERYQYIEYTGPLIPSGDVDDFVGLSYPIQDTLSELSISLLFDPQGDVTSGHIYISSEMVELDLSGNAASFGGRYVIGANSTCGCSLTGKLVDPPASTPEPGSFFLLSAPLGLLSLRRRARKRPAQSGGRLDDPPICVRLASCGADVNGPTPASCCCLRSRCAA